MTLFLRQRIKALPAREAVLAHKLMIETVEDDYMRRANVVWFRPAMKPGDS